MRFGAIIVPQVPDGDPEPYRDVLEQALRAEELGFDSVWLTEHHFSPYGRPGVEPLAAYVGARTKRIRIGVAIVVLPLHHPLRVAEDWATIDHLLEGRLEFGVGRGSQPAEFASFEIGLDTARERFKESLSIIRRSWTEDSFAHEGEFWNFPETKVLPKPYQQPHPRIWGTAVSDYSVKMMVDYGVHGIIGPYLTPYELLKENYFDVWHQAVRDAGRTDLQLAHNEFIYVGETEEQVKADAEKDVMWYVKLAAKIWGERDRSKVVDQYSNYADFLDHFEQLSFDEIYQDLSMLGTPDRVSEKVAWFEEQGVDELMAFLSFGGLSQEKSMRNMEMFATEVMPRFKESKKPVPA
ncbi:MAG: LLM class flavin-dependent oxidoreductase [Solirubrobacterales bacterium]